MPQERVPPPLEGERKPITALFADLVGSTSMAESLDPEDWAVVVNRLFQVASEAIARYEGTVTQLSGDAIVAVFGAPIAHEDDAERAVRAGLDLVAAVNELSASLRDEIGTDLVMRVGVNSGLAVVGSVGGESHEEYTALGDAMNVAARMQGAARPGTVLVTEATYEQVGDLVEAVGLGALDVKGKSEPIEAFEITRMVGRGAKRGIPGLMSPMVGREQEFERVAALFDVVRAGRGRAAIVLGEPGIGKSRLVAELRSRNAGLRWIAGQCLSYGRSLPYHLVADVVASMAGVEEDLDVAAVERLTSGLDEAIRTETTGHLLHLLGLPTSPEVAERLADLDPTAVRRRHVDALVAVLEDMAADTSLVLLCEDLHWADAASVDVLEELARVVHRAPVMLLGTARPDRESDGWRFVTHARSELGDALTEVRLDALSLDDSRALVANLLEIESLPAHVRDLIIERTDGNPFFVEEVVRSLIDDGLITRQGERWVASGDLTRLDVPESIHGLLLGRIDRLGPDARRALRVASVVGRTFTADLLEALIDEPLDVPSAVGSLEAHGLVTIATTRPGISYSFRHALVQEAAYSGLLKRERQSLHGRVADLLEEQHVDHPEEHAALLAHHLDVAGEHERAVPYLLEAGGQALARYANREATALFARAAELLADPSDPTSERRLVEARVGQVEAGRTFVPAGDQLRLMEEVLPTAEGLRDERLLARAHAAVADLYHYRGDLQSPQLERSMERALELAERLGDDTFVALPLEVSGDRAAGAGRYREAIAHHRRAVEILERRERLANPAIIAGGVAMSHAHLGEFDEADEWIARGGRLAEASGDPNAILDTDLFHGVIETERGNLEEAIEHTRRGLEQAQEIGNTDCALVGQFNLGDLHLRLGDVETAIPALEESSELAAFCNAGGFTALSQAWLAAARSRSGGDLAAELRGFEDSLETARSYGMAPGEAEIHRHRATVLAAQPDPDWDAVVADFEAAIAIYERIDARPALARTLHDFGMALDVAGRADEATAVLERAAALPEEMGLAPAS
jgi:class 3 adenylate cyclase/tetratricopeptide (TPR) repeat protein